MPETTMRRTRAVLAAAALALCLAACDGLIRVEWPYYTVVYHDGAGETATSSHRYGDPHFLMGDIFALPGHVFVGWSRTPGGGADFAGGARVQGLATRSGEILVLFAAWRPKTFTVSHCSNDGTGAVLHDPRTFTFGLEGHYLEPNTFANGPYMFRGWSTDPCGPEHVADGGPAWGIVPPRDGADVTLYAVWGKPAFTVAFLPNGGEGEGPPAMEVPAGGTMTLPHQHGLCLTGHAFGGWNTGSGEVLPVGGTFAPPGSVALHAEWIAIGADSFVVEFDPNGGEGPRPAPLAGIPGFGVVLPSGSGLYLAGHTFGGWNTRADGHGQALSAGSSFSPEEDVTLYAAWVPAGNVIVVFDANHGAGTPPPARTVPLGSAVTVPGGGGLYRDGFVFAGWNTDPGGTGAGFAVGDLFVPGASATLFAGWLPVFTVIFRANGGTGTPPPAHTATMGSSMTIPGGGGLYRTGFVFGGWNSGPDGAGAGFSVGDPFVPTGNAALYAVWIPLFTVTFAVNAGSGTPPPAQTVLRGSVLTVPGGVGLSRAGHVFVGWNTAPDASSTARLPGAAMAVECGNVTLHAIWSRFVFDTGTGAVTGFHGTERDLAIPSAINTVPVRSVDGTMADFGFRGRRLESVSIPPGVVSIGIDAFAYNDLTSVVIPAGVLSIGAGAFAGNGIVSVSMPAGVALGVMGGRHAMGIHGAAFLAFYDGGGRRAGEYSWVGDRWVWNGGTGGIGLALAPAHDLAADVGAGPFRLLDLMGGAAVSITVDNPGLYDPGSIAWFLGGVPAGGAGTVSGANGGTLALGAGIGIGTHRVTVVARRGGVPYSGTVTFTVVP